MAAVDVNSEPEHDNEDGSAVEPPTGAIDGEELPISAEIAPQQQDPHCEVRRSGRERRIPGKYSDFQLSFSAVPQSISPSQVLLDEPQTFAEAM